MPSLKSSNNRVVWYRWWRRPAGPIIEFWVHIFLVVVFASLALGLMGCSVDTSRPDYSVRLFEDSETRARRHDMRMQDLRNQQRNDSRRFMERHRLRNNIP